jgi:shikimate dehydrogenase
MMEKVEMSQILSLIGNGNDLNLQEKQFYSSILGESPSKGAKSPVLWNRAFDELGIPAQMYPMDVRTDNLEKVVNALRSDPNYIGGAVAVPFKKILLSLLDEVEPEGKAIGAINCIYRDGKKLIGCNTDGAGALYSLKTVMDEERLHGCTTLILGTGGAGSAVAAYMAAAIGSTGKLILANRTLVNARELAKKLSTQCSVELVELPVPSTLLKQANLLINCTSIGFEALHHDDKGGYFLRPYTPLGTVDMNIRVSTGEHSEFRYMTAAAEQIKKNLADTLNALTHLENALIYDIVYQPRQTILLDLAASCGLPILNGVGMNLEQAVIAYERVTRAVSLCHSDTKTIREIMKSVW